MTLMQHHFPPAVPTCRSSLVSTAEKSYKSIDEGGKVKTENFPGVKFKSWPLPTDTTQTLEKTEIIDDRSKYTSLDVERDFPAISFARSFGVTHWLFFFIHSTLEQLKVVVPICGFIELFSVVILQTSTPNPGVTILGMAACVLGLCFFLEGLTFGVMPLGEAFGDSLRYVAQRSEIAVFLIAFGLGVGVTYAEPAVGVLRLEGKAVDPALDPYVYTLLQLWPSTLVITIATGVGISCVLGTMRIIWDWSVKKILHITAMVAFTLSAILLFFTDIPMSALALAWDCGAVTTGPITVPLLLSLGAGLAPSNGFADSHSLGFVALASLCPVISVMTLILLIYASGYETNNLILPAMGTSSGMDLFQSLEQATINAMASMGPLIFFLVVLVRVVFQRPLPTVWATIEKDEDDDDVPVYDMRSETDSPVAVEHLPSSSESLSQDALSDDGGNIRQKVNPLMFCAMCTMGLALYNFGLEHGLTHMGDSTGGALPKALTIYSTWVGIFLIVAFALLLGYIATAAEPGLIIIENEMKRMTSGNFDVKIFHFWVPLGVAVGLMLGISAVIAGSSMFIVLAVMLTYPVSCVAGQRPPALTTAAIWDAAGVTTGEVTVPLVLSLGAQMARSSGLSGGFGLLALASVLPIGISLISTNFSKKASYDEMPSHFTSSGHDPVHSSDIELVAGPMTERGEVYTVKRLLPEYNPAQFIERETHPVSLNFPNSKSQSFHMVG